MAAKKTTATTTKTGRATKKGRPTIPSSHARGGARAPARGTSRDAAPEARTKRAPAGAATKPKAGAARGATSTRASAAKPGARPAARTGAARKTSLSAPKRASSLGETTPGGRPRKAKSGATPGAESVASDAARDLAILIAVAGLEKKAVGLEILDVSGKVDYADFLVVMTGRSDRQVSALAQGIEAALLQKGKRALSVEGMPHASWVLMDFGDVVVHVFQDEARSLYDIEGLWVDAKRIPVPDSENEAR